MIQDTHNRRMRGERGVALILTLFLVLATSVIVSSLMFIGQNETYAGTNYRLMSQARYGAESGVQAAANYLLYTYQVPTAGGADPIASYNYSGVSPVTFNGQPVVLSANPAVASNYPVAAVVAAFQAAAQGTLPVSNATVTYSPYATLVSMQQMTVYGGGIKTIQTWQIVADGTITSAAGRTAQVEVSATLETQPVPAHLYAVFGTSGTCGAVTFTNNAVTDSYDSRSLVGGNPVVANNNGNVGTNGNLGVSNNATINGTLSTPRVGVGNCSAGNVTADTASNGATITGGVVPLSQAVSYPPPNPPTPAPPTSTVTVDNNATCAVFVLTPPATCSGTRGNLTINPNGTTITLGNIAISNNASLTLNGGTYNINSINSQNNTTLAIGTGTVVMNVAGQGQTTPISISNSAVLNGSYDPSRFQIQYAGTGTIALDNHVSISAMIYAPNANMNLSNNGDFYGSMITSTTTVSDNGHIHYDRALNSEYYTTGPTMLAAFTWKKF